MIGRGHACLAVIAGVAILSVASLLPPVGILHGPEDNTHSDLAHYRDVAQRILDGQLPYRDFYLEYPPAAIPVFLAPRIAGPQHYQRHFRLVVWLLGALGIALLGFVLARTGTSFLRLYGSTALVGAAPIPFANDVFYDRYDVWPALIVLAALAALVSGRRRLAAAAAGFGTAAKIYPAVLLPLIILYRRQRPKTREVRADVAAFALPSIILALPFLALNPPSGGLAGTALFQLQRSLQIESLGGSLLLVADRLDLYHAHVFVSDAGSVDLRGGVPAAVAAIQVVLLVTALFVVWYLFTRGPRTSPALATAAAAAVAAYTTFGKILSPQYLIWLVFVVPLAAGRTWLPTVCAGTAAVVLTRLYYPKHYAEVVNVGAPTWMVLARNVMLVVLVLVLVLGMRRDVETEKRRRRCDRRH